MIILPISAEYRATLDNLSARGMYSAIYGRAVITGEIQIFEDAGWAGMLLWFEDGPPEAFYISSAETAERLGGKEAGVLFRTHVRGESFAAFYMWRTQITRAMPIPPMSVDGG